MTTGLNNFALDILNGTQWQTIQDAGRKAAVAILVTQLERYRVYTKAFGWESQPFDWCMSRHLSRFSIPATLSGGNLP
jgi:hypothetical protein